MPRATRSDAATLLVLAAMLVGAGCERPPVGGDGDADPIDGRAVVDLPRFLQDRPAIGGKWYAYNVDGHLLEPKAEAWVLRTVDGAFVAFRIVSIYDDNTGNSGVFHLDVAARDGDAWAPAVRFTAGQNVKDGATCVDVVAAAAGAPADRDCSVDEAWHLRLQQQQRLSVFAGFAIAEPAIFLHDGVRVARTDGEVALGDLPAPASLTELDDVPDFATTDWSFGELAADLPPAGQVLGAVDRVVDQTWWLWSSSFRLARFTVTSPAPTSLAFTVAVLPVDNADQSVSSDPAVLRDTVIAVDVDPAALPVYLSITDDGLVAVDSADALGGLAHPGNTRRWDLAVVDDGGTRVLLSPGAAALAGSALGLDPPFVP